ncbi:hypothetical protein HJC23_005074 [Cyclotella cryptica]|uniref:Core domain-containing protein n=1 Tax=Cyclotella cryptica TaxID=29204 RepID=A0ABD3QFB9_9STRA
MFTKISILLLAVSMIHCLNGVHSFSISTSNQKLAGFQRTLPVLLSSPDVNTQPPPSTDAESNYESPEDVIIRIKPKAMARLIELKQKRDTDPKNPVDASTPLILRMGVRNGGCSGLSYVMDFSTAEAIQEDDEVDKYDAEGIQCVVDAKSLLYLYGLELDYSDELIGGGFKFFNPNAEESCGCGSSFGV